MNLILKSEYSETTLEVKHGQIFANGDNDQPVCEIKGNTLIIHSTDFNNKFDEGIEVYV